MMPAAFDSLGEVVEDRPDRGLSLGRNVLHHVQDFLRCEGLLLARTSRRYFAVEGDQAHAVLLMDTR